MKAVALTIVLLGVALLASRPVFGQTFHLVDSAFGSSGSACEGASLRLGMTLGQAVTGIGGTTGGSPLSETVGFWRWDASRLVAVSGPTAPPIVRFALLPNTPNPFARSTSIRYAIPTTAGPTRVDLRLFDLSGRVVRVLESGACAPGLHSVRWSGDDDQGRPVGSGIYFCRIDAGPFSAVQRVVRIR